MEAAKQQAVPIRKLVGWALVAGLSLAAVTASFALLSGDLDELDWKVIGTSLGFSLCSALAASGASLRLRGDEAKRVLGGLTVLLAAATFVLLVALIWMEFDDEGVGRLWGCVALGSLAASHASLMVAGRRGSDSDAVSALTTASITLGALDAFMAIVAVSGAVEDVQEGLVEVFGVLVIGLLLTTALAPLVRRVQDTPRPPTVDASTAAHSRQGIPASAAFAAEVMSIADRIQALTAIPRLVPLRSGASASGSRNSPAHTRPDRLDARGSRLFPRPGA